MAELLIEIFSEEIPARMQRRALEDFMRLMADGMVEAGLSYSANTGYVTPRRLVLMMDEVPAESLATREERKGPRVDAPDQAIEGFLRSTGLTKDQLEIRDDKKGQVYFAVLTSPGRDAKVIIAELLDKTIRNFPWPKSMRWGDGALRWVRPLHSIIAILSDAEKSEIIPFEIEGIKAGNETRGHRFMADDAIKVSNAEDFMASLKKAKVILDPELRAETIRNDAKNAAFAMGFELVENEKLLAENAGLCEFPVVYTGEIEARFRELPPEVIETSMAEHQKFLSLRDPKSGQISGYVIVANRETADQGATIKAGNAKVLAARLSDAVFFWENDLRMAREEGLNAWADKLENVTFHNKLGSQKARIERIAALAGEIAPLVGADADLAKQAAKVAKADLSSEMVYEFPELQGLMGRYYAEAAGMPAEVAAACDEHYAPLGPSDDAPTAPVSIAVALADKLDLLTGFWAIDEKPTGSKDPFALRRAALGVIRIVLENEVSIPLRRTIIRKIRLFRRTGVYNSVEEFAAMPTELVVTRDGVTAGEAVQIRRKVLAEIDEQLKDTSGTLFADEPEFVPNLLSFIFDRLKGYLRDQNIRHDVIDAVMVRDDADDLSLSVARIRALNDLLSSEEGANLQAGIKRAFNILSAEESKDGENYSGDVDAKLLKEKAEKALHDELSASEGKITSALKAENFTEAMTLIGKLRPAIDAFFDDVIVNDDAAATRRNRLSLLGKIRALSVEIADFTKLEG